MAAPGPAATLLHTKQSFSKYFKQKLKNYSSLKQFPRSVLLFKD
jgi:hypothetical protein